MRCTRSLRHLPAAALGVLTLLSTSGCFSRRDEAGPDVDFGQPQRDYSLTKRGADPRPEASTLERRALLAVSPDRALTRVDVLMEASTYASARTETQAVADELVARIDAIEGCDARIDGSDAPVAAGREAWRGSVAVRVDADLGGLSDLAARTSRVDVCIEPLHTLRDDGGDAMDRAEIRVGAPWYTVDDPGQHREALLRVALAPLAEVAALGDTPPQFEARATRCTSRGDVSIVERSATEVGLTVDLECASTLGRGDIPGTDGPPPPASIDTQ